MSFSNQGCTFSTFLSSINEHDANFRRSHSNAGPATLSESAQPYKGRQTCTDVLAPQQEKNAFGPGDIIHCASVGNDGQAPTGSVTLEYVHHFADNQTGSGKGYLKGLIDDLLAIFQSSIFDYVIFGRHLTRKTQFYCLSSDQSDDELKSRIPLVCSTV